MEKKQCSLRPIGISIQRSSPKEIEAIYIKIRDGKILKSKEIGPKGKAVIDLDENGQVIGIEMLSPCTDRLYMQGNIFLVDGKPCTFGFCPVHDKIKFEIGDVSPMTITEAQALYDKIAAAKRQYEEKLPQSNQIPKMVEQMRNLKKLYPKIKEG